MAPAEWLLLVLLALGGTREGPLAQQQDRDLLRVGHWVKIKGALDRSGVFVADEIEVLPPDDKENLVGTVERIIDRDRFMLLGQQVRLSGKTEWKDVGLGDLEGARVRVQGYYRGVRNFSAREIASRGSGRDAIEGRIDGLELDGPYLRLTIMGFRVQVAADVDVEHEQPLAEIPLSPERFVGPQGIQRVEEEDVLGLIRLGEYLTLGGLVELEWTRKDNYDLNDERAADRTDYDLAARLETVWEPSPDFFALANVRMTQTWRRDEDDGRSHEDDLRVAELFGYWRDALDLGWDLQFGRQRVVESREWLFDQNLDALRLIRSAPAYRLELSASTTLSKGSERDENSTNLMAYLSNNSRRRHAAVYVLDRRDQEDSGEHFTHIGGRLIGEWLPQNQSWLEVAGLTGKTGGEDLGALGLDLGTTWLPDADWAPAVTLGWAWGSGDQEPQSGNNGTFRQTGFQDNNDKWSGVTSFRYYGELVDPELANLSIFTVGLGKRISRVHSLDLVWHRYDQVEAAPQLINTDLRSKPDGEHTYLGWEADLVFGSRAIKQTQLEIVLGWFEPGDAFPDGDAAWLGRVQVRWRF